MMDLPLQNAYANQFSENGQKTNWCLISSDQRPLGEWPKELNESQFFHILDFVRKYELNAYEIGRNDELIKAKAYINEMKKQYEHILKELRDENTKLATKLEELIIGQEN